MPLQSANTMDDELLDRLERVTVLGRQILPPSSEYCKTDDSLPFRVHLSDRSRQVWSELLRSDQTESEVRSALNDAQQYFEPILDVPRPGQRPDALSCLADDVLIDHWINRRQESTRKKGRGSDDSQDPYSWYIKTDPFSLLSQLEEPGSATSSRVTNANWDTVYNLLALLEIDLALRYSEEGEPFKAAVAASRASEAYATALGYRWASTSASLIGQKGANVRHLTNRSNKSEAIKIYRSRKWNSRAEAGRTIGKELDVNDRVVERWIRDYLKGAP